VRVQSMRDARREAEKGAGCVAGVVERRQGADARASIEGGSGAGSAGTARARGSSTQQAAGRRTLQTRERERPSLRLPFRSPTPPVDAAVAALLCHAPAAFRPGRRSLAALSAPLSAARCWCGDEGCCLTGAGTEHSTARSGAGLRQHILPLPGGSIQGGTARRALHPAGRLGGFRPRSAAGCSCCRAHDKHSSCTRR
jgi:hypothetical protein